MTDAIERYSASSYEDWPGELVGDMRRNTINGRVGGTLVSESERVRVWHIHLAPGESLPFHRHVLDYFWTAIAAGRSRSYYEGGNVREFDYAIGDTMHFSFVDGEYMLHNLVNVGDTPLAFVTVELKGGANLPIDIGSGTLAPIARGQAMLDASPTESRLR